MKVSFSDETLVFALGGLGEVGKNLYCIEHKDSLFIIDAGVKFPEADLLGIDYVIPDFTYLVRNQYKIKALLITHGHEDHIGGIPFLLQKVNIPLIYAPRLASALIKFKLEEFKSKEKFKIVEYNEDTPPIRFGDIMIDFVEMTHSTPDAFGIRVKTPNGTIFTTGDFKVDLTPVGNDIGLSKLAKIGDDGVTLMLSDSTNAEVEGISLSEASVVNSINEVFRDAQGRIIVATFSSNVYRIQQIVETAVKFGRKILIFGRSMEKTIQIARQFGYINCPDNYIVNPETMKYTPPNELLIMCTGSQGEPMAALSRIAMGSHKSFKIFPGDTVVFSSSPIPGNAPSVNNIINLLTRNGATVLTNSILTNLHASGHAGQEEMKLLLKLIRPRYFMPVHGEYRMQKLHCQLGEAVGVPKENNFICDNGDVLRINDGKVYRGEHIDTDDIYIDGNDYSGLSTAVIKDRKVLADDGIVACVVALNSHENLIEKDPVIYTRGFCFQTDNDKILRKAEKLIKLELDKLLKNKITFSDIKNTIRTCLSSFIFSNTHRSPMIIPVLLNRRVIEEKTQNA